MTCCPNPVHKRVSDKRVECQNCRFGWVLGPKKNPKSEWDRADLWRTKWFCKDSYDRGWRFRDFDRHEVVGTRRIGNRDEYVVACPKSNTQTYVEKGSEEIYCDECDRSGLLGPMIERYKARKFEDA